MRTFRGKMKFANVMLMTVLCFCTVIGMEPSDMSLAMFKSARIKVPTVFKAKIKVAEWDGVSYGARAPIEKYRDQFLAVYVSPYQSRMEQSREWIVSYVKKDGDAGKILMDALRDGGVHAAFVKLRYSDKPLFENVCILEEVEMIGDLRGDEITAKFTNTKISFVRGKTCDYLQGKIGVNIKSKLKFFRRPILRVVLFMDENGTRVVRDAIMDEPNIKVVNESDTIVTQTSTYGTDENEPMGGMKTIEEISKNQSEVSKELFSSVAYVGLLLGTQTRHGLKGYRTRHMFGYACFDKDEKAKLIGYRIEMWYCGECVTTYDSLSIAARKRLQLPDDWHVSFMYPQKFKYRPPRSKKIAVRY